MSGSAKLKALLDYARGNAIVHSLFAITYGMATVVWSDALWLGGVYDTAKEIPFAPESWGFIAMLSGSMILYGARNGQVFVKWGCGILSAWCFIFAIFFAIDCIANKTPLGIPGVISYLYIALLVVHRGVLAEKLEGK